MLISARIAAAPTLEQVLTLPQARTDLPVIPPPVADVKATATFKAPNPIQKSLVSAHAVQQGKDPAQVLSTIQTRQDAIDYFNANAAPRKPAGS
jgi:phospholipase C